MNTYTSEEPDEEGGPLLNVPMRIASRQTRSAAGDRTKSELNSKYSLSGSVADPCHFGVDPIPDLRIHASG